MLSQTVHHMQVKGITILLKLQISLLLLSLVERSRCDSVVWVLGTHNNRMDDSDAGPSETCMSHWHH